MTTAAIDQTGRNFNKFMQWDITHHCNLSCAHCRSTEYYKGSRVKDLPLETNKQIVDDLYLNGVRRIHFLGGEPLTRKDFCDFAEYVGELGIVWSVNTNGTLLTENTARRLLAANAHVITISLDGPTDESNDAVRGKGVFQKVCENASRLTHILKTEKKNTRVVIACTLVKQNADKITKMVDLAKELGVNSLILSSLQLKGSAVKAVQKLSINQSTELKMAEEIAEKITRGSTQHVQLGFLTAIGTQYINEKFGTSFPIYDSRCEAIVSKGYIQPDGALFACQALTDTGNIPSKIGLIQRKSIVDHGFEKIWYDSRMHDIKEQLFHQDVDQRMLPCKYCKYYRVICYPCPLGAIGKSNSIHLNCLEAMSGLSAVRGVSAPWDEFLSQHTGSDNSSFNRKEQTQ